MGRRSCNGKERMGRRTGGMRETGTELDTLREFYNLTVRSKKTDMLFKMIR